MLQSPSLSLSLCSRPTCALLTSILSSLHPALKKNNITKFPNVHSRVRNSSNSTPVVVDVTQTWQAPLFLPPTHPTPPLPPLPLHPSLPSPSDNFTCSVNPSVFPISSLPLFAWSPNNQITVCEMIMWNVNPQSYFLSTGISLRCVKILFSETQGESHLLISRPVLLTGQSLMAINPSPNPTYRYHCIPFIDYIFGTLVRVTLFFIF